jgi:glucose-1-phosphatase
LTPVKLVVFDLGGVMIRIRHAWSEILGEMGLELPSGFSQDRLAQHQLLTDFQNGDLSEAEFLAGLGAEFGLSVDEVGRAHGLILRDEYPGARELVADLTAAGVMVYCLSNTNSLHYREFFSGRFPVCEAFDELLASQNLGMSKPDPRIYQFVEDKAGVTGSEIVFFDDAVKNVEAAKDQGWAAFVVDPEGDPPGSIRLILGQLGILGH